MRYFLNAAGYGAMGVALFLFAQVVWDRNGNRWVGTGLYIFSLLTMLVGSAWLVNAGAEGQTEWGLFVQNFLAPITRLFGSVVVTAYAIKRHKTVVKAVSSIADLRSKYLPEKQETNVA